MPLTSLAVTALPPIPHSPDLNSDTLTQVTGRMASPSMLTVGDLLDHLLLLLRREDALDQLNVY